MNLWKGYKLVHVITRNLQNKVWQTGRPRKARQLPGPQLRSQSVGDTAVTAADTRLSISTPDIKP